MNKHATNLVTALNKDSALRAKFKAAGNAGFEQAAKDAGYPVTRQEFADSVRGLMVEHSLPKADSFSVTDGIILTQITTVL